MRKVCLAVLLVFPVTAVAIEYEPDLLSSKVRYESSVVVVESPFGVSYLNEVPPAAVSVELFTALPKKYQSKATLALTTGDAMTVDDVQSVLDAWYRDTAVDFDSLRIRGLTLGERGFVVYCTEMTLFGCAAGNVLAGTSVTYEINGANRSGGMTGFQRRTVVIRHEERPSPDS